MKKFKLSKSLIIILSTILLIIVGAIIVGNIANDEVKAAGGCTCADGEHGPFTYTYSNYGEGTHRVNVHCGQCGGVFSYYDESCVPAGWQPSANVSNTHAKYCTKCHYATETGTCYDNTGDGTCDVCGNTIGSSGGGSSSGGTSGNYKYDWYSATQHYYWSTSGGNRYLENHTSSSWADQGNGTHWALCDKCGGGATFEHSGATEENGGKCTGCGAVYVTYEKHEASSTITTYKTSATGHTPVYACSVEGCTETFDGTEVAHSGATHSDGTCTTCGYEYENHGKSSTITKYNTTSTGHKAVYSCTESTCGVTYEGTEEEHSGATEANGGTCEICGATYVTYEEHKASSTITTYKTSATGHTPVYACSVEGCTETFDGTEVAHSGASHSNGGKCTICGYTYQTHEKSSTVSSYTKTSSTHKANYKCTYSGCTETFSGTEVSHSGAKHSNGGKCTTCSYKYQTHSQSSTIKSYTKTETTHTPIYACTYSGCTSTYTGTATNHTYQDGACIQCGQDDPNYEGTVECSHSYETEYNESEHWQICSKCGEEKENSRETHSFTNYVSNNDATCESDGTKTATCNGCSATETKIDEGSMLEHNYQNGTCINCGKEEDRQDEENLEITSTKYEIDTTYILNVQPETKASDFKINISTNATAIYIYNENNVIVNDDETIATGMRITVQKGSETKTFTIIVKGDANGDGEADFKDIVKINQARLNRITLDPIFVLAADVTEDGNADFKDLVKINRFRLNKITEL